VNPNGSSSLPSLLDSRPGTASEETARRISGGSGKLAENISHLRLGGSSRSGSPAMHASRGPPGGGGISAQSSSGVFGSPKPGSGGKPGLGGLGALTGLSPRLSPRVTKSDTAAAFSELGSKGSKNMSHAATFRMKASSTDMGARAHRSKGKGTSRRAHESAVGLCRLNQVDQ
jgi:hypothetical protein